MIWLTDLEALPHGTCIFREESSISETRIGVTDIKVLFGKTVTHNPCSKEETQEGSEFKGHPELLSELKSSFNT